MYPAQILIADDDIEIIKFVSANLKYEKYETLVAMNGIEAIEIVEREMPDLVILDIMMPKMDGFEVCKNIRKWSQIPIIVLSARGDVDDKIKCLELGADDYISKPFKLSELMARIKAVSRRKKDFLNELPGQTIFRHGDLVMDFTQHRVAVNGKDVDLTPTEYKIIRHLAVNAGSFIAIDQLLKKVWGEEHTGDISLLQVYIGRLRIKLLDNAKNHKYIRTKTNIGYMMVKDS